MNPTTNNAEIKSPGSQTEVQSLLNFLTQQLRPQVNWSIDSEYPQVFQERNRHNLKLIEVNGQPVTHAALRPIILQTPQLMLKVGAIGSVVTDPQFRGHGYSRQVIQECLEQAQRQDCDFAILWSDLHDFYRKLGFELAGFEEYFLIQKPLPVNTSLLRFMQSNQVDPEAILRLYNKHTIHSYRTADEIRQFLKIPNTKLYTAWSDQNQLMAYAVEGKGADLTGFIHEWGGQIEEICQLINYVLEQKKQPFTMLLGPHNVNLMTRLQRFGISGQQGYLGLIKLLNTLSFGKKVQKLARQQKLNFELLQLESGQYQITFEGQRLYFKNESELVRIFFGPLPRLDLNPENEQKWQRFLPLSTWIWGWDSI